MRQFQSVLSFLKTNILVSYVRRILGSLSLQIIISVPWIFSDHLRGVSKLFLAQKQNKMYGLVNLLVTFYNENNFRRMGIALINLHVNIGFYIIGVIQALKSKAPLLRHYHVRPFNIFFQWTIYAFKNKKQNT